MRSEWHMTQAAPADVATSAPPPFDRPRRVEVACVDDDDLEVTPRHPLDMAEPPRATNT